MLRTNLATRPFYNERVVHAVLLLVLVLTVALTVFNVARIVSLSRRHAEVSGRAARAETKAAALRRSADGVRRSINARELEAVAAEARQANDIIDGRTFSWTDLFNQFETTLPEEVRIVSVAPRIERDGRMIVAMAVVGRRTEDIDSFVEKLEATGTFSGLLTHQQSVNQDGMLDTILEGRYWRTPRATANGRP
jgi:hypothetical protein